MTGTQPPRTIIPPRVHHEFVLRKQLKNGVDKVIEDGQNPYNSHPKPMTPACKHPVVKVVAREDDIEFVECQQCGEVFDSAEYVDIAIEEEEALADHRSED
jgi:Zn ribbon nucleic-acid-binding protein